MNVIVNGSVREVPDGTDLYSVVVALGHGTRGIAAAVNGEVVPASRWEATPLRPDDLVEVLGAAQGG